MRGKKPAKCKLIVSSHNYQYTPSIEDLGNLVAAIQASGADIVKIATTAVDITDVARVFQITVHSQVSGIRSLAFPFTVVEWTLPTAPRPGQTAQSRQLGVVSEESATVAQGGTSSPRSSSADSMWKPFWNS